MITELKPYPSYRSSGVEWLGNVPEHWHITSVKRYYSIQLGKMLQPQSRDINDYQVQYLKAKNVQWFDIDVTNTDTMYANNDEAIQYEVRPGDLLVCEGGEGGRCAVVANIMVKPFIIQNALHRVRPHSKLGENMSRNDYLQYVLSTVSSAGWFNVLNDKATIAHFTAEKFGALTVPIPILPEQTAITRFLDHTTSEIERYIRAKEKLISLLEEQKQVIVHDAVTGRIDVRTGKPYPAYKPSGIEWLRSVPTHWEVVRNGRLFVQRNEIGWPDLPILEVSLRYGVRVRDFKDSNRKQIMSDRSMYKRTIKGDIAYNMMRMWQGAVGVVPVDGLVSPAYVVAKPLLETESRYFENLFRTKVYMTEVDKRSRGIVKDRNRLYWEDFKQILSPRPPQREQILIADSIERNIEFINSGVRNIRRLIHLAEEYRTRLIADVVTGKLDVREAAAKLPQINSEIHDDGINSILSEHHSLNTRHDNEQEARP